MDKKIVVGVGIFLVLLMVAYPVGAVGIGFGNDHSDKEKPSILIEEGKGREAGLIKVTHIHYVKSAPKARPPKTETCYKLGGWKWTKPVTYTINPNDGAFIFSTIRTADNEWDEYTSKSLFTAPEAGAYPWYTYDGKNSISFGDYDSSGVIAVTVTWYNRFTKVAVESDILFDTDFTWGDATQNADVMDLQNIATHEIGHTLGLSDLYTGSCFSVTMYGYSWEGDTQKRSLEQPDITGLQKIYGS
jgi:hypothetical protein